MTKKDLASKLAHGVRQVRQPSPPSMTDAAPATPAGIQHHTRQEEPAPSLDQCWLNLHPERIWPD